ncbi:MAG: sugar phosphate isomerase/epimerase family protein [Anaerolineae bacterium]|jgi:sugar phosphate isomerase/epimerase
MKLAVNVGSVGDGTLNGCINYCKDLEVEGVVLTAAAVPGYQETRMLDATALKDQVVAVQDAGLSTGTMQYWPPYPIADEAQAEAALSTLTRNMDAAAEAGIHVLAMFTSLNKPVDPADEGAEWDKLIRFYTKLTSEAEQRNLKIAAHFSGHRGRSLLAGSEAYRRLFEAVPSPSNGLTFCVGNAWVSDGERTYNVMREFADRIFFYHMRSTKISWGESPYWWDIPDGPDIPQVFRVLKEIGYEGFVASEHMPDIRGENRHDISTAWGIGYMKAILQQM